MSEIVTRREGGRAPLGSRIAKAMLLGPIALYRLTLSPLIGVNCRPLIEQHGSLHCITMQYPAQVTQVTP